MDLGEEEKMRFRGGEVVFQRLKIRYKTTNVAKIDVEKLEEVSRHVESAAGLQRFLTSW